MPIRLSHDCAVERGIGLGHGEEHVVEHAVGIYIALVGIACVVGILTKWLTHLPYTIALVLVGLALAVFKVGPAIAETGFRGQRGEELVFFVLLPPLLFQGAFHMQIERLRRHMIPIAIFATIGVFATTLIIGFITFKTGVFESILIAMLFGAIICTTDPVSVLAIFRHFDVPPDLKYLVEGESLFNDGTGVVVFGIVLSILMPDKGSPFEDGFHIAPAVVEFLKVSCGGAAIGLGLGYLTYRVLRHLVDHLLENTICLVCCYGSFWVAHTLGLSGVIAVVCAGVLLGNHGRRLAMKPKTTETVETFFESIDFLINSILFIIIGLELRAIPLIDLRGHLGDIAIAVAAMLIARAVVVYPLFLATRRIARDYPARWAHILFWGGLRGSIPIALLVGLRSDLTPAGIRETLLVIGFGVVCFSLIVQGLTMKPLILALDLQLEAEPIEPDPAHHQEGL